MSQIRLAVAQINPTVGALGGNTDKIVTFAREAAEKGAEIVVFPELVLSGYPPEDLVLKQHFVSDCRREVERVAREAPAGIVTLVGTPWRADGRMFNAAVVLHQGGLQGVYHKMLLPNYGVFDEKRVFESGERAVALRIGDRLAGLHICEDSWFADGAPTTLLRPLHPDVLINLSASPYNRGKLADRVKALSRTAAALGCPLVYANLVGGQDELVFDGISLVLGPDGQVIARARAFEEQLVVFDLILPTDSSPPSRDAAEGAVSIIELDRPSSSPKGALPPEVAPLPADLEKVYGALKLGLRDYVDKNGFGKVLVALSGGIDSALVAALAVDALGAGPRGRRDHALAVLVGGDARRCGGAGRATWASSLPQRAHRRAVRATTCGTWPPCGRGASRTPPRRTCRPGFAATSSWPSPTSSAGWS